VEIRISLDADRERDLRAIFDGIPDRVDKIIVRAVNKTVDGVERAMVRQIRQVLNVTNTQLRKGTKHFRGVRKSKVSQEGDSRIGGVSVASQQIPIIFFGARERSGSVSSTKRRARLQKGPNPRGGVTYKAFKFKPRAFIHQAFIPNLKTGHKGVFVRKSSQPGWMGKMRHELRHLSLAQALPPKSMAFLQNVAEVEFGKEFDESLRVVLKGFV
jgi:hypothetical protein